MANVLNRTTKQYLESVNTPDYPTEDWIINPDLSSVSGVDKKYWFLDGDTVREMTAAEKDAAYLSTAKTEKCGAIDLRTVELISAGFVYSSKTFSLSDAAQHKLMGIHQIRDDAGTSYPIKWNTIDDTDVISLADSAAVHSFYTQAVSTYRGHVDGGTSLKDQVRAATTVAGVEAITDSR